MFEIFASIQGAVPLFQSAAGQWLGTIVLFIPLVRFVRLQHTDARNSHTSAVPAQS